MVASRWLRWRGAGLGLSVIAIAAGALGAGHGAAATTDPNAFVTSQEYLTTDDGVRLHAWVHRPAGVPPGGRTPVLMEISPYTGSSVRLALAAETAPMPPGLLVLGDAFARGYTVVQVELRGYGASGGCPDLGGPGEQTDARAAVEWAARQPWSTGRVGLFGSSYSGWTQLMALAGRPEGLAAVAPGAALSNLAERLYTNRIPHMWLQKMYGGTYAGLALIPPGADEGTDGLGSSVQGRDSVECEAGFTSPTLTESDPAHPFYGERDLRARLAGATVPMFLTHGFHDENVFPSHWTSFVADLEGEVEAWIGQWAHGGARYEDAPEYVEALMAFYDRHVHGPAPRRPRDTFIVQQADGQWRKETTWPPADTRMLELPVRPGTYADVPGNYATPDGDEQAPSTVPVFPGGAGTWTITRPLPHAAHLVGTPQVELRVETSRGGAPVVVLLYDIDPDGLAHLISRGAWQAGLGVQDATFALLPQDWPLRSGHRLGLLVAASDHSRYETVHTGDTVSVHGGTWTLPLLACERRDTFDLEPPKRRRDLAPLPLDPGTVHDAEYLTPLPQPHGRPGCRSRP